MSYIEITKMTQNDNMKCSTSLQMKKMTDSGNIGRTEPTSLRSKYLISVIIW